MSSQLEGVELESVIKELSSFNTSAPEAESATPFSWKEEFEQGDLLGALAKIDTVLIDTPDDLAARLWWVNCQAELGSVPAVALSAPLEEITSRLKERADLHPHSISAFLRVAKRLIEKKQTKLAVMLLERAREFSNLIPDSSTEETIRQQLLATLKQEYEKADLKREPKSYLEGIQRKIDELDAQPVENFVQAEATKKAANKRLSSSSLLEAALAERDLDSDFENGKTVLSDIVPGASEQHTKQAIIICLLGGLMILLGFFSAQIFGTKSSNIQEQAVVNLLPQPNAVPEFKLAPLEISADSASLSLELAQRRLEKVRGEGDTQALTWNGEKPRDERALGRVVPQNSDSQLINPEPKVDKNKLPELNPDKLAEVVVDNLNVASQRIASTKIVRGADGRIYGPPPLDPSARDLQGERLQPLEVEQLNPPRMYKVIAPTAVFSAPSVVAPEVSRLSAQAKIQVVSKLGRWLELKSKGGRRGYIYAQDAVPE